MKRLSIIGYLIAAVALFIYSFVQIDLGLPLTRWSVWQVIQKFFQNIGYQQRPLSSGLFIGIILVLFIFYFLILNLVRKGRISKKSIWTLIILVSVILTFSYNAFSYDLFNYIFDAKIVTYYHQSPYLHKALDYIGDPMLGFMRWTHRIYPYGPIWLGLTIPLSYLGLQRFLPTFFLFKILITVCFLGTTYFVGKIMQKNTPKDELFAISFFALNPLVVMESLVSAHNDVATIFFSVWSIYLLMNHKYIRSIILFILSIGIKFITVFLIPIYLLFFYWKKKKKIVNWDWIFKISTILMIIPVIIASFKTTFQPWYLLNILTFAALIMRNHYVFIPSLTITLIVSFEYLPYFYTGNWNNPIPMILNWMTIGSIIVSLFIVFIWSFKKNNKI